MTSMMIYHPGHAFEKYAQNNPFEMGIFLEFTLPYYLIINSGFYEFNVDEKFFNPYLNKSRKIAFELESHLRENQSISLREATFQYAPNDLSIWNYKYNVFHSGLRILIETYYDEKEAILKELSKDSKKITIDLIQSCLEYILFRYNESTNGIHAISPSVYDCSHLSFNLVYSNFIVEQIILNGNLTTIGQISDDDFKDTLKSKAVVWKEFINESKYAYKTYDYKKSIIYTAVSFESFISNFIYGNTQNPGVYETSSKGYFISIGAKVDKLMDDNILRSNLSKLEISTCLNDITYPRNDMMHGKIFELTNLRDKAKRSLDAFERLQNNWI